MQHGAQGAQGSGLLGSLVIGAPSDGKPLTFSRSLLLAIVLEAVLLVTSCALILHTSAKAELPKDQPVQIVIEDQPEKIAPEKPPEPKVIIKPKVSPLPQKIVQPPVIAPQVVRVTAVPQSAPPVQTTPEPVESPAPAIVSPVAQVQPVPPVPTPPPQKTNEAAAREAEFAARVKAAVQAAVTYPAAARSMGLSGRARMEFHWRDGVASQVRVIQSSGTAMLDRAATESVTRAGYPEAPDTLKGKNLVYQVTVVFDLASAR